MSKQKSVTQPNSATGAGDEGTDVLVMEAVSMRQDKRKKMYRRSKNQRVIKNVDQHLALRLVNELPTSLPGHRVATKTPPEHLPTMTNTDDAGSYVCNFCKVTCITFHTLEQHRAGNKHRVQALKAVLKKNRFGGFIG